MATIKLKHAREASDTYSSATSERTKQYAFAALAVVWILAGGASTNRLPDSISSDLLWTALFAVVVLAADFLQYFSSYAVWANITQRQAGENVSEDSEFTIPPYANILGHLFYWSKVVLLMITYIQLIVVLVRRLS